MWSDLPAGGKKKNETVEEEELDLAGRDMASVEYSYV